MSYSMDDFMAMPFDDAKRALGTGEMPAMLEAPRVPASGSKTSRSNGSSWHATPESGGAPHHHDVGGTEKLANWAVEDSDTYGQGGRLGQNQLLADWDQGGGGRRGSDSSWASTSAPSSRRAERQYPDSFTGKNRARHPVLTDKPADRPEYVGDGGHSFGANQARAPRGSDLQPTMPGGRTGGWPSGGSGGGGGGAGSGQGIGGGSSSGGGGGARPSRATAAPAHVIMGPVAD